jgi:hypothetical protein
VDTVFIGSYAGPYWADQVGRLSSFSLNCKANRFDHLVYGHLSLTLYNTLIVIDLRLLFSFLSHHFLAFVGCARTLLLRDLCSSIIISIYA